jgi:hypothetical protein
MTGGEWCSSMLPFLGEERKGQRPFWKGKGAFMTALVSHAEGRREDTTARQRPVAGVNRHLD